MSQIFRINSKSVLPTLRVELIDDAKYDFFKSYTFNNGIQNADVTFTMWDEDEVLKISKAPCTIILSEQSGCDQRYIIEYAWKERDTKKPGHYKGRFEIDFKDDLYEQDKIYQGGKLIVPIYEELDIIIK